jgi:hypothetical protein
MNTMQLCNPYIELFYKFFEYVKPFNVQENIKYVRDIESQTYLVYKKDIESQTYIIDIEDVSIKKSGKIIESDLIYEMKEEV